MSSVLEEREASDSRFEATEFVIEANDFEIHSLWRSYHYDPPDCDKTPWEQDTAGLMITVGTLNGNNVNISVQWAEVDGMLMMFYWACSRFVDHDLVDQWLKKNCNPAWCSGKRRARTDASNFHAALAAAREKRKELENVG